jgi:hypothetical protein
MKEMIYINKLVDWKMLYRTTTTLSKTIITATDWKQTKETLMYSRITNSETSQEDQKYRTFKLKLLIEGLPTKKLMHERYPQIYQNSKCIKCNNHEETSIHALTCSNGIKELQGEFFTIVRKKIQKVHNHSKSHELIEKEFKNHSDYQIDHNRINTVKTNEYSTFSFIDIIRNIIPKSLKKILKKIMKIETKEIEKIIKNIIQEFTKKIHKKWLERCEIVNKWEENNNITAEIKRNTKAQYIRNEENYEKIKKKLETRKPKVIETALDNLLNVTNTSFSYILSSLFLSLDISGTVAVETY